MIPVEVCFLVGMIAFGIIGLSRTLPRELGATVGFTAMILALVILGTRVGPVAARGLEIAGFSVSQDLAAWIAITFVILITIVAVYQGETLTIHSLVSPGPAGKILDFGAGLINGWLVLGTWWYATHVLSYPMTQLGLFVLPLSPRAERLVGFTPLAILPDERAVVYVAIFLVILIGLKVAR